MLLPKIIRRVPFVVLLLAFLSGAWLRLEAAPVSTLTGWRHATLPTRTEPLPDDFDRSAERASAAIAAVRFDVDDDGDLDIVGVDGALALLVWENDGAGRLTLKDPLELTALTSDAPDITLDTPSAADDSSDQSDTPSDGLARRCEPFVSPYSRPLTIERSAPLRSRTRSSRTPRAPPVLPRAV
jgi:hypothetical protein